MNSIAATFAIVALLGTAASAARAHPDGSAMPRAAGTSGPVAGPMRHAMMGMMQDDATAGDMRLVHELLFGHDKIRRTVTNLKDGIRTATESDDPQIAQSIKAHVASMTQRLTDGREFNLFSPTLPVLFEKKDKIRTLTQVTDGGVIVTQTSEDGSVVAALQAHAGEVSDLAREGMIAMMRSARGFMGPMQHPAMH